jgi:tetratricopeptide (TPR) repeat protein
LTARSALCGALLLLVGATVYSGALGIPLVNDDYDAIVTNPTIRNLADLSEVLAPPRDTTVAGRPVANLSFAVDLALFHGRLLGFHLTNVAIHLLAALILFGLARRLLRSPASLRLSQVEADWIAAAISLLWVVHPLHVVAVGYVVQRVESLMGLFALATLYAAVRALEGARQRAWTLVALLTCGLGMATKEVMAGVPLLVMLLDRAFFFPSWRDAWRARRGLYLGLASTGAVLLLLVASHPRDLSAGSHASSLTPLEYLRMQCIVLTAYLVLIFRPVNLVFDYGDALTSIAVPHSVSEWGPGAFVLCGLAALAAFAWSRGRRDVGFLGAWFFILLAPSSSLVPIVTEPAAEHRLYLPLLAPLSLAICGLWSLLARAIHASRAIGLALACAGAVCAGLLGRLTLLRCEAYATAESLWEDSAAHWPSSSRVYLHLGQLRAARGEHAAAEQSFVRAIALDDNEVWAHYHLAQELEKRGAWAEALSHYRKCLHRIPKPGLAEFHIANDLVELNRFAEAMPLYDRAVELDPGHIEYASRRAAASARAGHPRPEENARILSRAPDYPGAFLDDAEMRLAVRDGAGALQDLVQAVRLDRMNEDSWRRLGVLEACLAHVPSFGCEAGAVDSSLAAEARRAFQQAVLLNHEDGHAREALALLPVDSMSRNNAASSEGMNEPPSPVQRGAPAEQRATSPVFRRLWN